MAEQRKIIFEKYEMGRLLGKGTFAKVYYAKNLVTGESVAIKVLSKDQVKKQGMMEQIKREISVMKLVRHPNVVDLKEVMATKSKIYFVMEYVKGGELFAKVLNGRLKEEEARRYFQQLISAVDYCHSRGVSHRDLKPENLLLDENGNLKVSDFGLSALPEQVKNDGLLHTRCGTPAYVAPEVLRKKGYDGAETDLWSCGAVLYVLLAGFLPFQHENMMVMHGRIFKAEYEVPPWVSNEAKRVISKLLVVDPARRVGIPAIMRMPWFRKNFEPPRGFEVEKKRLKSSGSEVGVGGAAVAVCETATKPLSAAFFNAFELISSMASGFDLSGLFEIKEKKKAGSIFSSRCSARKAVREIEAVAGRLRLKLLGKEKDFRVRMEGYSVGRKGRLTVTAEVFELAPQVAMVEFSKSAGDTLEYEKFLEEEIRPSLKDIVWTWKGESDHTLS